MLGFQDQAHFEFRTWKVRDEKPAFAGRQVAEVLEINDFALKLLNKFKSLHYILCHTVRKKGV